MERKRPIAKSTSAHPRTNRHHRELSKDLAIAVLISVQERQRMRGVKESKWSSSSFLRAVLYAKMHMKSALKDVPPLAWGPGSTNLRTSLTSMRRKAQYTANLRTALCTQTTFAIWMTSVLESIDDDDYI